jgi:cellulose synthase/poly-beta-1,6-N-acetylglucosamine synthase-like glycosyltransferase
MITVFYILATLTLLEGVGSLLSGIKYHRFVVGALRAPEGPYQPRVTLIVPFKGIDPGLAENVRALLDQDYAGFNVLFVTSGLEDPVYLELKDLARTSRVPIKLITAGPAKACGQKVYNLLKAVEQIDAETEVLVFADSDARPHRAWLRQLVAPLADERVGIATGYRWYLPTRGGFWSVMQSVWNAGIATLLGDHKHNFAWGGSMAIRRHTFDEARVREHWRGALSDDYAMGHAVKKAGYRVTFVPRCLIPTHHDGTFAELLEWASRQIIITKVYSRRLWLLSAVSQFIYNSVLIGGVLLVWHRAVTGENVTAPLTIIITILSLGILKGTLRLFTITKALERHAEQVKRYWWGYCLLTPIVSWLTLYAILKSLTTNRITWRGITYELKSPSETKIIAN